MSNVRKLKHRKCTTYGYKFLYNGNNNTSDDKIDENGMINDSCIINYVIDSNANEYKDLDM